MEEPLFFNWFACSFVPYVIKKRKYLGLNSNVLLLYDGHCSQIRIIELVIKNNVILLKFPSHLTDRLQPLDKCVFGPLKSMWDKELVYFGKTMIGKSPGRLTKAMFSEILGKVWLVGMKKENIILVSEQQVFPVDKNQYPISYFDPTELNYYFRIEAEKQNILHSSVELITSNKENIMTESSKLNDENILIEPSTSNCEHALKELTISNSENVRSN